MMDKIVMMAAIVATLSVPAQAQNTGGMIPGCEPYPALAKRLAEKSHEGVIGRGVMPGGASVFELWASFGGNTWTTVLVHPSGIGCMTGFGADFNAEPFPPEWKGPHV